MADHRNENTVEEFCTEDASDYLKWAMCKIKRNVGCNVQTIVVIVLLALLVYVLTNKDAQAQVQEVTGIVIPVIPGVTA
jgi:hypothetical protein